MAFLDVKLVPGLAPKKTASTVLAVVYRIDTVEDTHTLEARDGVTAGTKPGPRILWHWSHSDREYSQLDSCSIFQFKVQ